MQFLHKLFLKVYLKVLEFLFIQLFLEGINIL